MARWPSKARSDWKLRPRAGSFQRKSLERGMFARALACGLCWSWLWVACAGAAHMPTTTTADTASNDNRHGRRQQREPLGGPHTPDTGDGDTEDTSHSRQPSPRVTRRRLMRAPATVDLAEPPVETRSGERTCRAGDKFCP